VILTGKFIIRGDSTSFVYSLDLLNRFTSYVLIFYLNKFVLSQNKTHCIV